MPRSYRHIKQYEKELFELKSQGVTLQQIGEKFGFSRNQIKECLKNVVKLMGIAEYIFGWQDKGSTIILKQSFV